MKKCKAFCIALSICCFLDAQTDTSKTVFPDQLKETLSALASANLVKPLIEDLKHTLTTDPALYNKAWAKIMAIKNNSDRFQLFKDLDIQFKTFQVQDPARTGLGFLYNWNFDWRKYHTDKKIRNGISFQLNADGNVAFKKMLNPNDLMTTGISFGGFQYTGGVLNKSSVELNTLLNDLELVLATMPSVDAIEQSEEWKTFNEKLQLTDQFYFGLDGAIHLENTQDFERKQWAYGIKMGMGAKGWSDHSTLAYLNLPDYPFALLRMILGHDKNFAPDGATVPVFLFRLDLIDPTGDDVRKSLTGNKKNFARFSFETGFRTLVADIKNQQIYFNADYRFFQEMNAPQIIKIVGLDKQRYFSASITSSSGMFVSFATGRLPFDQVDDQVYSLGFNYRFN